MTPEQFKTIRSELRLSQRKLAGRLDINYRTIQRWEAGEWPIPRMAIMAMRYLFLTDA